MADYGFSIAIVLFPGVEELDFVGPWEVFSMAKLLGAGLDVFTVGWPEKRIVCGKGMVVEASYGWDERPQASAVIVPGGKGTRTLVKEDDFLSELRSYMADAKWHVSVCTGAAILGRIGFLEGRRATTNRAGIDFVREHAPRTEFLQEERYVQDSGVITSAGVSAGIDMSLWLLGHLFGQQIARETQRAMEYYPEPPYGTTR